MDRIVLAFFFFFPFLSFPGHKPKNPSNHAFGSPAETAGGVRYPSGNLITIKMLQSQSLPLRWIQTQTPNLTLLCTSAAEEEGKEMPLKVEVTTASG